MSFILDDVKGMIKIPSALLFFPRRMIHDEFCGQRIVIFGSGNTSLFLTLFFWHTSSFFLADGWVGKRSLAIWVSWSVFGAALFTVLDAYGVQGATDDVVSNSWKVFDPSPRMRTTECS